MYTSYFAKRKKLLEMGYSNLISIAGKSMDDFIKFYGDDICKHEYKKLAPKYWFFLKYKTDGDENYYIEQYNKEVIEKLDPNLVFKELGDDAVLLCWESPKKFCHRHLVADWLNKKLGIEVKEIVF